MAKSFNFNYRERSVESANERSQMGSGAYDRFVIDGIQMWKPRSGSNIIRILPPTWEDARHYGYDVFLHNNIGPDRSSYLCLNKMKEESCPLCDARAETEDEDDQKELRVTRRVAVYLIDRDDEAAGAQLWFMPWSVDRDIIGRCIRKRTGKLLMIDHPERGYDIEFQKQGEGLKTKYVSIDISRETSVMLDDEEDRDKILQFISDKSIPDVLKFYSYEYIDKVFNAVSTKRTEELVKKPAKSKKTHRDGDSDEDFDDIDELLDPTKKKTTTKREVEEEEDLPVPPLKKTAKKPTPVEDEDEEVEEVKPAKKTTEKKAPPPVEEEEDDEEEFDEVKAASKTTVEEDDDDDDVPFASAKSRLNDRVKPTETKRKK